MSDTYAQTSYEPPVSQLLTLGDITMGEKWYDYQRFGFTREHVAALIRMATDRNLHWAEEESQEVWAPLHAWRTLAQLGAIEAIEPLLNQLDELESDDWFQADLAAVMELLGPQALPALTFYLDSITADDRRLGYLVVTESVERIGKKYLEARPQCQALLTRYLERFADNDEGFNGCLIQSLLELRARRALPTIAAAFEAAQVDNWLVDWEDVQQTFRLAPGTRPQDVSRQRQ
jgi:hypothetical protein